MQRAIRAVFMRGGTSKGLFFRASDLAQFPLASRNEMILSAMGSPDPDARQIDGMGGGLSSLSKVVVLSTPGEAAHITNKPGFGFEDGVSWADDVHRSKGEGDEDSGWDVVYRFAQVGVTNQDVDWKSTCGNLVAAVAHYAIDEKLAHSRVLREIARQRPLVSSPFPVPVRILAVDSGKVVRAIVRVQLSSSGPGPNSDFESEYFACTQGDVSIAGVPGTSAPVEIENLLGRDILPTGRVVDTITIEGEKIACTIIDAGLPTIFVAPSAVFPLSSVASSVHLTPSQLDASPTIKERMEVLRVTAARLTPRLSQNVTASSPKICIVWPRMGYITTGGVDIPSDEVDVVVRGVSVGNFHRTVPATMLSALAVAGALKGSVVEEVAGGENR